MSFFFLFLLFVVCITIFPLLNPTNIWHEKRDSIYKIITAQSTLIYKKKMAWLRLYMGISVDFLCLPKAKHSFLRLLVDITCLIHNGTQIPFTSPWRGNLELVSERRRMWKFQDGDEIFDFLSVLEEAVLLLLQTASPTHSTTYHDSLWLHFIIPGRFMLSLHRFKAVS